MLAQTAGLQDYFAQNGMRTRLPARSREDADRQATSLKRECPAADVRVIQFGAGYGIEVLRYVNTYTPRN